MEQILEIDDTYFECKSIIEFTSLIKILFKLSQRQKHLEDKIDFVNKRVDEKEKRLSNLEIQIKGQSQSEDKKIIQPFDSSPKVIEKKTPLKNEKYESSSKNINKQNILSDEDEDKYEEKDEEKDNEKNEEEEEREDKKEEEKEKKEEKEEKKGKDENEEKEEKEEKKEEKEEKEEREGKEEKEQKEEEKEQNIEKEEKEEKKQSEDKEEKREKEEKEEDKREISEKEEKEKREYKESEQKVEKKEKYEKEESGRKEEAENNQQGLINPDMIRSLFKRVKDNEKKIAELVKKSYEHNTLDKKINNNHDLINVNTKKIENLQKLLDDLVNQFDDFKADYEDVKVKVQDFNIYDIIKGDGSNVGDVDITKSLIMSLENKIFKKFSFYDERNKNYDKDIHQIKEDIKNSNNLIDDNKLLVEKNNQEIKELNTNYEQEISQLQEKIESLQKELDDLDKNKNNSIKHLEKKIKKIEEELNNLINKELDEEKINNLINKILSDKELNYQKKGSEKILKDDQETNKNNMKKFYELEKMIKDSLEEIDAKGIKDRLQLLENELLKKFTKKEGTDVKNKLFALEEEIKEEAYKNEIMQQGWDKIRSEISNLVKKIEFLNGEYSKLSFQKATSNTIKTESNIDILKFLEKNEYENNKKDVNNKFEKVRLAIENLGRNLENILNSLSHTVSDKELINFQGVINNTIDELKLSIYKKYADKNETNKTLKFLETQLKTILEQSVKKADGADNWLLAKKPLNNYLCASCESILKGDLDKRSEYIPWNKYPSREDKSYRMGHGFSRMLQMVNDDIMKNTNTDNINANLFFNANSNNTSNLNNFNISNIKDSPKEEDINNNSQINNASNNIGTVKLPKVKIKSIITNSNINTLDLNSQTSRNRDDDQYLSLREINRPQIMKIYKINKNPNLSQNIVINNNLNPDLHNSHIALSQKKIRPNEDINIKLYNTNIKNNSQLK